MALVGSAVDVSAPRKSSRRRSVPWALFVALVLSNVVDLTTTRLVLRHGGAEGNPLMVPIVGSVFSAAALKCICLAAIGLLVVRSGARPRLLWVLAAVDLWYVMVVVWNIRVLVALS